MENILFIATNLFKNDSAAIRNLSFVNGLVENKKKVTVVTLDFDESLEDLFLKNTIHNDVKILKIKIPKFNKMMLFLNKSNSRERKIISIIKKFLKNILFFPDVYKEAIINIKDIQIEENYDYIISSSDSKTSHFIAKKIIEKFNFTSKWIQIWGDPWYRDIGLKNIDIFTKLRIKFNEKRILKEANKIFYISELTANDIRKQYSDFTNKIFSLKRSYLKTIEENLKKEKIIFTYTGTVKNRNLFPLIEKIEEYNNLHEKKIELQFWGATQEEIGIEKSYLKAFGRVSFEKVIEVYKKSDVLIYIDNLGDTTQIPGKIYDYFGTNRIILGLIEKEPVRNYLARFNRIHLFNNNKNEIELEETIKNLGIGRVLEEFSPKIVAKEFLEIVRKESL